MTSSRTRRGPRVAVVAAAAALLALAAPSSASANTAGRIAFTANLHGSWQLFTMTPTGTGLRQVTHIPGSTDLNMFQKWSPDGQRLAYTSGVSGTADVYTVRADGTDTRRITGGPADDLAPTWAPDGRHLVFARLDDNGARLYRIDVDGTHLRRLTDLDGFAAQYTPDGRHIVFDSNRGGLVSAVWIMNADGSAPRRLTPAGLQGTTWDVSPDGTRILLGNHQNSSLPTSLFDMKLDGTDLRRLTSAGCCYHDANARYSPDGRHIAFTTDRTGASRGLREDEIWTMTADGHDQHPVTSSLTPGGCPDELVVNCVGPADWSRTST